MKFVMNEREYAERIIRTQKLSNAWYGDLESVARYYLASGRKSNEVDRKVNDLLNLHKPDLPAYERINRVEKIMRSAKKYEMRDIDGVWITKTEIETVGGLASEPLKRIAFVLLCWAKYRNAISDRNNNWSKSDGRDFWKSVDIKASVRQRDEYIRGLAELGLITHCKNPKKLDVRVEFVDGEGEGALFVDDFRSLGNQYMMYTGGRYVKCKECGLVVGRKSNSQKYCNDCAKEIYVRQNVNSVMRGRNVLNNEKKASNVGK